MRQRVYRVDRFTVPAFARDEFIEQVRRTHEVLRELPGFIEDRVLERAAGSSHVSVVTMVTWQDQAAAEDARVAVTVAQRKAGFDKHRFLSRLGVEVDIGSFREVELFGHATSGLSPSSP